MSQRQLTCGEIKFNQGNGSVECNFCKAEGPEVFCNKQSTWDAEPIKGGET